MTAALAYAKRKKAETGKPVTVTTLVIKAVAMVCTTVLPHLGDAGRHAPLSVTHGRVRRV